MIDRLAGFVGAELDRPETAAEQAIATAALERWGRSVACILFYGAKRRDRDRDGWFDLYVLTDGYAGVHRSRLMAFANRLLPPNVFFLSTPFEGGTIRAKVAVMSRRAFAARMRMESLDTTLWTRFCQPSTLLYARDPAVAPWAAETLASALRTAFAWADHLAGSNATVEQKWRTLFRQTYRLEIRPERNGRSDLVYEAASAWFDGAGALIADGDSARSRRSSWRVRAIVGKPLNLLRLMKAAFTFADGADYLSDKLSRHTGIEIVPSGWQRRHPLLGAPFILLAHQRKKAVRRREQKLSTH